MKSLRARAVAGGILSAAVIVTLGFTGLLSFTDQQANLSFRDLLRNRHDAAVAAVEAHFQTPDIIPTDIHDPEYLFLISGQYWQIEQNNGVMLSSFSLGDQELPRPDAPADGRLMTLMIDLNGQSLLTIGQWRTMPDGKKWHVQVASSLEPLLADRMHLRTNLLLAFGVVIAIGIIGALLQVTIVLQPLNALRRDVLSRWTDENGLKVDEYPSEVAPLVTDINILLDHNRELGHRSRQQAADLAHAVKTPSAIIRNELEALRTNGVAVNVSIDALDRLDAQLNRSFARFRANGNQTKIPMFTDISVALDRIARASSALATNAEKRLTFDVAKGLHIRIDQSDFDEVIGNLIDNALKWAKSEVRVVAHRLGDVICIRLEDDGPGIPEADIALVTQSGMRLDTAQPGTGLGLAIVNDLIHVYGGRLMLGRSKTLGGLCATVCLDVSFEKHP